MEPRDLLRVEGLAAFAVATAAYFAGGGGWLLFVALVLAPDLSIAGYLAASRAGAVAYNAAHLAALPALLLAGAWYVDWPLGVDVALIWLAHLGIDRAAGFGLKYPGAAFSETHLQRV